MEKIKDKLTLFNLILSIIVSLVTLFSTRFIISENVKENYILLSTHMREVDSLNKRILDLSTEYDLLQDRLQESDRKLSINHAEEIQVLKLEKEDLFTKRQELMARSSPLHFGDEHIPPIEVDDIDLQIEMINDRIRFLMMDV